MEMEYIFSSFILIISTHIFHFYLILTSISNFSN